MQTAGPFVWSVPLHHLLTATALNATALSILEREELSSIYIIAIIAIHGAMHYSPPPAAKSSYCQWLQLPQFPPD